MTRALDTLADAVTRATVALGLAVLALSGGGLLAAVVQAIEGVAK